MFFFWTLYFNIMFFVGMYFNLMCFNRFVNLTLLTLFSVHFSDMAEQYPPTPVLLDATIDAEHRAFRLAVLHEQPPALRCRSPAEVLPVDDRWAGRYYFNFFTSLHLLQY